MIAVESVAQNAGIGRFVPGEVLNTHRRIVDPPSQTWQDFLFTLIGKVDRADQDAENRRHRKWLTNLQFFAGEQAGFIDREGGWYNIPIHPWDEGYEPGDPIYVINILQFFVRSLMKDYARSQVIVDVNSVSSKFEMRAAARPASALVRHLQRNEWTALKNNRDAKFTIITGNSFRYTFCDNTAGGYHKEPVYERRKVALGGYSYFCLNPECVEPVGDARNLIGGDVGNPQQGQQVGQRICPSCGSDQIQMGGGAEVEPEVVTGYELRARPGVSTAVVDPFEVKLPLNAPDIYAAQWLRRQRYIERTRVQVAFPWAQLRSGSVAAIDGDTALNHQRQMQTSAGNLDGHVSGVIGGFDNDFTLLRQYWFRPEEYAEFRFATDEMMANGEMVQRGQRALELFPDGMYVAVCGNAILELANEDKRRHWTHNRWDVMPSAIWAYGIEHMVEGQARRNDVWSLMFEKLMYHSNTPVMLDQSYWDKDEWSSVPGTVMVSKRGAPQGGIGGTVQQLPATPGGPAEAAFLENTKADMQLLSGGTFSSVSGLPDVHTSTYGGMAIQRDEALSLFESQFKLKAESDTNDAAHWLWIVHKHNLAEQYFKRMSAYNELEIKAFRECQIDVDLEIVARPGSFWPRSMLESKQDWTEALTMGGLPLGIYNPMLPPVIRRKLSEVFNVPGYAELASADERNTWINLRALLEMAAKTERDYQMPDDPMAVMQIAPMALAKAAELAPVLARHDDADVAMDVITEFRKTDEGRHLTALAELLIEDLYSRYQAAKQQKAMEQMANDPAMMLPPMGAEPGAAPGGPPQGPPSKGGPVAPKQPTRPPMATGGNPGFSPSRGPAQAGLGMS